MDETLTKQLVSLQDADPRNRASAAKELAQSQQSLQKAITELIVAAGDRNDEVRMWAAEALETADSPDIQDLSRIVEILESEADGEVAYWATTCLGRLGPLAAPAVGPLTVTLAESSYLPVRERAAWALGRIGPAARPAASVLQQLVHSDAARLSRLASIALKSISERAA